jgi:drug/metabolite transporter (DMT)-like permease
MVYVSCPPREFLGNPRKRPWGMRTCEVVPSIAIAGPERLTVGFAIRGQAGTMDTRTKYIILVLASALVVAFESVSVEGALKIADIDILLVSTVPLLSGGLILIATSPKATIQFTKGLGRKGWFGMTVMCILGALGSFMWFDAVGRIGASKEALLGGGSSEVLLIVLLSAVFLRERLTKKETLGSGLVLVGVFVVLANARSLSLSIGLGELEAMLSSFFFAGSVVISTYLLWTHDLTALSGFQLLYCGFLMFIGALIVGVSSIPDMAGFGILILIGAFPAAGLWMYNSGLPKIGASLTSVLFALTGVITVGVQLAVLAIVPDADIRLPQSIPLALVGGGLAFVGVYMLSAKGKIMESESGEKQSAEGEI